MSPAIAAHVGAMLLEPVGVRYEDGERRPIVAWSHTLADYTEGPLDFAIPAEIQRYLAELDAFIEREIKPLEHAHPEYFDHRREHARTNWDDDGKPRREWEDFLGEMCHRADQAGHYRFSFPEELGGRNGDNLAMAIIREHLAHKGLGLHNDLQNESSIVGNFPQVHLRHRYGTAAQKARFFAAMITGEETVAFGLTEPNHGSDATWLETTTVRDGADCS